MSFSKSNLAVSSPLHGNQSAEFCERWVITEVDEANAVFRFYPSKQASGDSVGMRAKGYEKTLAINRDFL
jgi:hypothetical protein